MVQETACRMKLVDEKYGKSSTEREYPKGTVTS